MNISCHSFPACKVSVEIFAGSCMGNPLYITSCFSLAAFKIYFSLTFDTLIIMCLVWVSLGSSSYLEHCGFPGLDVSFLSQVGSLQPLYFFFSLNKFIYFFIYLFLAVLGLCCCMRAFSSCGEWGLLSVAVHRLLSHCGGFSCCGAWALGMRASVVVAHGLSSCGTQAQ